MTEEIDHEAERAQMELIAMMRSESLVVQLQSQLARLDTFRARAVVDTRDAGDRPNLEHNPGVSPYDLIGTNAYALGQLQKVRYGDPTLAPAMQKLQRRLEGMQPRVVPPAKPTLEETYIAERLDHALQRISGGPASLLARVVDQVLWVGRAASEVRLHPSHWRDGQPYLEFFSLAPHTIRFHADESGARLLGVAQIAGSGWIMPGHGAPGYVPADRLFYLGVHRSPGDFEGWAEVGRPFLALNLIREALVTSYLATAQAGRGVPLFMETSANSSQGKQAASLIEWIKAFAAGHVQPGIVPFGYEPKTFNPTGQLPDIVPVLRYLDECARYMAGDALSSLGVSATGSRALGEEFGSADATRFHDFVISFLRRLNSASEPYTDLLHILSRAWGVAVPQGCRWPTLVYEGLAAIPVHHQMRLIREARDAGVDLEVTPADLTKIRHDVGLAAVEIDAGEDVTQPEGRVDRDIAIARALRLGEMTPDQAAVAYERNGHDIDEAHRLAGVERQDDEEELETAPEHSLQANADTDLSVTDGMRDAARRGLELRREYGRGGTETGVARARDIANGRNLSPETWRRMRAFFSRHQQNRDAQKRMPDGGPTAGWIAWLLWGGDAGQSRANAVVRSLDASTGHHHHGPGCGCGHTTLDASTAPRASLARPGDTVDFDAIEAFLDAQRDALARDLQSVSRLHREAFAASAPADPAGIVDHEVDFSEQYEDVLLRRMRMAMMRGARVADDELREVMWRPVDEPFTAEMLESMRLKARLRGRQLNDDANDQMRAAALGVAEDEATESTLDRWVLPITIGTLVGGTLVVDAFTTAHNVAIQRSTDASAALFATEVQVAPGVFRYADGTTLERTADGRWVETLPDGRTRDHIARPVGTRYVTHDTRLDRHVCAECAEIEGLVTQVGSQRYWDTLPQYARCMSAKNLERGNHCRCEKTALPPYEGAARADWMRDRREAAERLAEQRGGQDE